MDIANNQVNQSLWKLQSQAMSLCVCALSNFRKLAVTVRAVTQVLCGFAPVSICCHPKFSDCFLSFSEEGIVSLTDVSGGHGQVMQQFQLQSSPYAQEGSRFTSCDISFTGDVYIFGDTVGNLQLWGTDLESTLNPISAPLPVATDTSFESCSTFPMDENGPLACVPLFGLGSEGESLLSDLGNFGKK